VIGCKVGTAGLFEEAVERVIEGENEGVIEGEDLQVVDWIVEEQS
jgi:hypothetical protein